MNAFIFILLLLLLLLIIGFNSYKYNVFVQLSASSLNYLVYLPIVLKSWSMIGFNSIVIITYHKLNNNSIYIKNIINKLGCEVILLNINYKYSLHYTSKLVRIYGYEVSKRVKKWDYLFLSDADMIPFSQSFFNDFNYNKLTIKSFDKNGYGFGNNKGRWAMCYFVANKFVWKEILNHGVRSNDIRDVISNIIDNEIKKGEKYFESFVFIDEVYMRDKIKQWKYFNSNVIFHPRNFSNTRIDRAKWPKNIIRINPKDVIDIHLPKFPLKVEKMKNFWINIIMPLQQFLFNSTPFGINYINNIISLHN